jgi:arylsulfotransferase ASST
VVAALIVADAYGTANLTSIGGPADQKVVDSIVQEIDIRTGQVLFQWNNADHIPYRDSEQPRPASAATPWDWSYINAVHLDTDGNLLISSRYTWTVDKVSLRTGKIIWELGGKQSSSSPRTW